MKNLSFRTRLIVGVLWLTLLGMSVCTGLVGLQARASAKTAALDRMTLLAQREATVLQIEFDKVMAAVRSLSYAVAASHGAGQAPSREQFDLMQQGMLSNMPTLVGLYMGWEPNALDQRDADYSGKPGHDASGRYVPYWNRGSGQIAVEPLLDYDKPGPGDYYQLPKQNGRDALIEPYLYKIQGTDHLITSLVSPIKVKGSFVGIVGADLLLSRLQEMLASIKPYDTGRAMLISHGGAYAAHPDNTQLGKPAADLPEAARAALKAGKPYYYEQGDTGSQLEPIRLEGVDTPWAVRIDFPLEAALAPANAVLWVSAGTGLASLLAMALLLTWLIGRSTRPLLALSEQIDRLSSGRLDLTARVVVGRHDEIGRIAMAVNAMLERLRGLVSEIHRQSDHIERDSQALDELARSVAGRSSRQSDFSGSTAAVVEEMAVSINHVADSTHEASEAAQQSTALSHEAVERVEATAGDIGTVDQTMSSVKQMVQRLDSRAREIDAIATVIKGVADQTNLLALNAAIEAARAGEQGRGFAVVADEVRQLAERTGQATVEIARMIQGIQQESSATVRQVEAASNQIAAGVEQSSRAAEALRRILDHTRSLSARINEIDAATREQSSSSHDIARNVEAISNMAQENDGAVKSALQAAERLRRQAAELREQVAQFKL
ncbi:methyl-accepting chemotaxis protein [Chitinimonas lacunae]|uniref:Methyl-accepting chemotaxis protein n=1 Tax=Chitinimonas lacunae TaxID=1963018 RepID=A0ABV8MWB9_9NEIS